jgi:hypothetical protein
MDGRRTKAKLQTVSVTGGLMVMNQPLAEGDFVEIVFATPSGQVNGMAEMLTAKKMFTSGCQQAFRFVALGDNDHQNLRRAVESSMDRRILGIHSKCAASGWTL